MTKRPNPFDDYAPVQRKMHIGAKEVNQGVESELRMKQVYERTKTLLYENRVSNGGNSDQLANGHHHNDPCPKPQSTGSKYKQLCLDAFGQLQRITGPSSSSTVGQLSSSSCPSCSKPTYHKTNSKCSFCENVACDGCLRRCFSCNNDFCSLCSLQIYDRSEDKSVCLSCSTT